MSFASALSNAPRRPSPKKIHLEEYFNVRTHGHRLCLRILPNSLLRDHGGRLSLNLEDERLIKATPEDVWSAISDARVLKDCVPGCTDMSGSLEDGFNAVVVQKVGPVKATFKGQVTFSNIVSGQSATITGEGQGGVAGFAKGGADIELIPQDGQTLLKYSVDASVGGKLAQLGSRIIDSFAGKMADQFFESFQTIVEGGDRATFVEPDPPSGGGFIAWLMRLFGRAA